MAAQQHAEDSNDDSDDGQASDRDDDGMDSMNGSMEHNRAAFPAGFLGLHPLMPGPSGMHGDNFGEWRILRLCYGWRFDTCLWFPFLVIIIITYCVCCVMN